jgi:hypothetical protein
MMLILSSRKEELLRCRLAFGGTTKPREQYNNELYKTGDAKEMQNPASIEEKRKKKKNPQRIADEQGGEERAEPLTETEHNETKKIGVERV